MNKKKICMFFLGFLLAFGLFIPATEAKAAEGVTIDETTFPDAVFRQYVLDTIDTDKDEILETEEISIVTDIYVSYESITSLKGVEYFTFLKTLYCGGNQLMSLDVSKNEALSELDCYGNQLTSLDVSKNGALSELKCYRNQLTSLDVSKNEALTELLCYGNRLTSLDVSKNSMLTVLNCNSNIGRVCPLVKLTDLPGFDPAKASNWNGATYDAESGKLTEITSGAVTYDYDCGNGYC